VPDNRRYKTLKINLRARFAAVTLNRRAAACTFVEKPPRMFTGR